MKNICFTAIFNILFSLFVCSCSDGNYWDNAELVPSLVSRYLNISDHNISFGASASTRVVNVESLHTSWLISGIDSTWLEVSPKDGDSDTKVDFAVLENVSGDDSRTCILNFESTSEGYDYQSQLSVTQSYASPYITPEKTSYSFSGSETTFEIPVKSNIKWDASCTKKWVEVLPNTDGTAIRVKVGANDSGSSRSASIVLKGKIEQTITLSQAMAQIHVNSSGTLQIDKDGGTYEMRFSSEAPWTAETSEAWLSVNPSIGDVKESRLQISATPNETSNSRTGYVYLKIGGKTIIELKVSQSGCYIETMVKEITFGSNEATNEIQVNSNTKWEVLECPSWISVSPKSGDGNMLISISVKDNPNASDCHGTVRIGRANSTIYTDIEVTQRGKVFGEIASKLHFEDFASSKEVDVQTDGQWTAGTHESDWITVTPTSGRGNGVLKISVTENIGTDTRAGRVSVSVGNTTRWINIEQSGKYFVIDTSHTPTIPAIGGSHTISFKTNETWVASSSSKWITLSQSSGQGDANIKITAADNPSIYTRKDTTVISPSVHKPVMVITKQDAKYLKLNVLSLSYFSKGGTSDLITIDTNGIFTITTKQSWITINQSDKTFTVTVTKNSEGTRREGKVSVSLIGLANGETCIAEIPVIQTDETTKIVTIAFPEDEDWNLK